MINPSRIREKLASLPELPGVYLFKDAPGNIIYIGKAKSLKKRAQSYFSRQLDTKTQKMVSQIADLEFILAPSESRALFLEAGLVHKYKPRYNVMLRDNKNFPYVKITNEEFPAICVTRKPQPDGARYLGPYTSAKLLRQALAAIRSSFPFRSCRQMPEQACMYYRLGLSPAPCAGKISKKEYSRTIAQIRMILEGRTDSLVKRLSRQMLLMSGQRKYEQAAKIRDQINVLSALSRGKSSPYIQFEAEELKNLLKLEKIPERIEAFDISNISGSEATGSLVSFYRGVPDKDNYRRFRIKTVVSINDYDMLREVLRRRYSRLIRERLPLPDVVLIDGGKAHLQAAEQEINKLGLGLPLISIAKDRENIYLKARRLPIKFKSDTAALNLIRRVRDEAHRFALAYHHLLRRKKLIGG
ncbi:MAG: excinuclease ABC subunit UvrC [Candidatus Omnitrophota bacterium]|nr:excinuclease ABC subunit UvrC [Candidatus Omnitrophota bacterium]